MYSIVKQPRTRRQRKHEREILLAPPTEGDLTTFYCSGMPELKLSAHNDQQTQPLIPPLLDAKLTTMHGNKMLFKGIERGSDGAEYVQEWSVQIDDR